MARYVQVSVNSTRWVRVGEWLTAEQFTPSASVRQAHQSQQTRYTRLAKLRQFEPAQNDITLQQQQQQQQQQQYYMLILQPAGPVGGYIVESGKSLIVGSSSKSSAAGWLRWLSDPHNWLMMFGLIAEVGMSASGNEMTACLAPRRQIIKWRSLSLCLWQMMICYRKLAVIFALRRSNFNSSIVNRVCCQPFRWSTMYHSQSSQCVLNARSPA